MSDTPRYRRHPALVLWWEGEQPVFHNYLRRRSLRPEPETFQFLCFFATWRDRAAIQAAFPHLEPRVLAGAVQRLHAAGLLEAEGDAAPAEGGVLDWEWTLPTKLFHLAIRNIDFATTIEEQIGLYMERLKHAPQPPLFHSRPGSLHLDLPRVLEGRSGTLDEALLARRTCRQWLRQPISTMDLARLLYLTWGVTGCQVDAVTGPLLHKTSPSGGSRHPTEVYPVVLNVDGVAPGIYHYAVEHHRLERVRGGHFGALMAWIAAGQSWLQNAAVICVMTCRVERTMWKYPSDRAYRVMTLELGHFCQTFYLLSAGMGLGAFTTAAFRDKELERELDVDGAWEPAMYLCAAGVADPAEFTTLELCVRRDADGTLRLDDPLWHPPAGTA